MAKTPFNTPTFDVKQYGAKGDGTTNDTVAIKAALAAAKASTATGGGVVYFPVGTYILDSPLEYLGRYVIQGGDARGTQILARSVAAGGFTGDQMIRNWVASDWTGGETDHRQVPASVATSMLYPRIEGISFHPNDNPNLDLMRFRGCDETSYIRDVILYAGGYGDGTVNRGTRGLGLGYGPQHPGDFENITFYGTCWDSAIDINIAGLAGAAYTFKDCDIGQSHFRALIYVKNTFDVNFLGCHIEGETKPGALATIYAENVEGFNFYNCNWTITTASPPRTVDWANVNVAAGKTKGGISLKDIHLFWSGSSAWFGSGAALIRDPFHVIDPQATSIGGVTATNANGIETIRHLSESEVEVRYNAAGQVGHELSPAPAIPGVTDTQLNLTYLNPSGANANRGFQTADAADVGLLTGCDIRCLIEPATWSPAAFQFVVCKYGSGAAGTRSWGLGLTTSGRLQWTYSVSGTAGIGMVSTAGPTGTGPKWIRVVSDPTTGGVVTATFYTSTDGVTWTQLGTPVTNATVGPWFDSTTPVEVGQAFATNSPYTGKLYEVQLRNLAGTFVAGLVPPAAGSYTDSTGHVWTRGDSAVVVATQTITPDKIAPGTTGQRLAPTVSSGGVPVWTAPPMFNVKDYGAVGDGVTNDSAAIQATIAAVEAQSYGIVFFPPGRYNLVTGLTASTGAATYVEFLGAGPTGYGLPLSSATSQLLVPAGSTGLVYGPAATSYYTGAPYVRNMAFRGPGATSDASTIGLALRGVSGGIIENCSFTNFCDITNNGASPTLSGSGTGLKLINSGGETAYVTVRNSKFMLCYLGADCGTGSSWGSLFDGCLFDGNRNLVSPNVPPAGTIGIKDPYAVVDCRMQSYDKLIQVTRTTNGHTFTNNRFENFITGIEFPAAANAFAARIVGGSIFSGISTHVVLRIGAGATDIFADFRGRNAGFSRYDNQGSNNPIHFDATSIPTSGTHGIGEYAWLRTPVAGGTQGWVCTTAGTPGTWKTFGAIQA